MEWFDSNKGKSEFQDSSKNKIHKDSKNEKKNHQIKSNIKCLLLKMKKSKFNKKKKLEKRLEGEKKEIGVLYTIKMFVCYVLKKT